MEDGTVNVRRYTKRNTKSVSVDDFVQAILADTTNKSRVEIKKQSQSERNIFQSRKVTTISAVIFIFYLI